MAYNNSGHGRGCSCMQGRGPGPPAHIGGFPQDGGCPQGGFPPTMGTIGCPIDTPGRPAGGSPLYRAPPAMNGRYGSPSGLGIPPGPPGVHLGAQTNVQQQPCANVVKRYANWNACYSCGFDVADGRTSMSCPPHLQKAMYHIGFNCQNAQQYINLGHPCSTHNRHKMQFPTNM
jgi:hypothetical protein